MQSIRQRMHSSFTIDAPLPSPPLESTGIVLVELTTTCRACVHWVGLPSIRKRPCRRSHPLTTVKIRPQSWVVGQRCANPEQVSVRVLIPLVKGQECTRKWRVDISPNATDISIRNESDNCMPMAET